MIVIFMGLPFERFLHGILVGRRDARLDLDQDLSGHGVGVNGVTPGIFAARRLP
jgi:hypothetical protein